MFPVKELEYLTCYSPFYRLFENSLAEYLMRRLFMDNFKIFTMAFNFLFIVIGLSYGSVGKDESMKSKKSLDSLKLGILLQHYTGSRSGSELSLGPQIVYKELVKLLAEMEIEESSKDVVKLTQEEKKDYGVWHRLGLADGHLGRIIAGIIKEGKFPLGLLGNCNGLMGMLAGLQHSGPTRRPLKAGLVWIDAHGDFNTPETTLSGMLGGMPVACAAGKCLFRLRLKAGLDPAIPTRHIIMMCVRDLDPLEAELIDNSNITMISTEEMVSWDKRVQDAMERLSKQVDVIYVHIDLDVLDPAEIPGANLTAPNGPTAAQMGEALKRIMAYKKVGAFGAASFPLAEEGRNKNIQSTLKVIRGVLAGLKERQAQRSPAMTRGI